MLLLLAVASLALPQSEPVVPDAAVQAADAAVRRDDARGDAGDPATGIPVRVVNAAGVARSELVACPLPLPRGALASPPGGAALCAVDVLVDGTSEAAPGLPLLHWPDGSIALLLVHWRIDVPALGTRDVRLRPRRAEDGSAVPHRTAPHRPAPVDPEDLWTELVDPWGRVFRADLVPDPDAGPSGVLWDTGAVQVRRFRAPHRLMISGGDPPGVATGGPLLDLRAYLVTFDGERRAELTLVLDNQEPTAGPLGPIRFRGFRVCIADEALRMVPAFARENLLPPPTRRDSGGVDQWLLAPGTQHYLGDGTAKAFRLHLFRDGDDVDPAQRDAAAWAPVRCVAFAGVDAVRRSRAFGAHGGPAPVEVSDTGDVGRQLAVWRKTARLGPYTGFGDPENGSLGGSPRHGDSLLHNVLRWQSPRLLQVAESMVLQHGLRPTGGREPRLPADTADYRQGMPRTAIELPHGFVPVDYEHCSAHLLFDYFWLTGDPWARDELARLGRMIPAMLSAVPFRTSRGEGHCLEAGALCAKATGDGRLLQWLIRHVADTLAPALAESSTGLALPQPPHPLIFDGRTPFDAPVQMAALLRGLCALHAATGDERLVPLVVRVADAMAGSAWLPGTGPKTLVAQGSPGRYSMAASPEDRLGSDRITIGAFVLAAELAPDADAARRLRSRAEFLLVREGQIGANLPIRLLSGANPWMQIVLDRREER